MFQNNREIRGKKAMLRIDKAFLKKDKSLYPHLLICRDVKGSLTQTLGSYKSITGEIGLWSPHHRDESNPHG